MGFHCSAEYTDLAEVEPTCLANILELLHEHEQLIITRVESQRLVLTERGTYLASTGTPFAAWAKEFHSQGTVSTPRLKVSSVPRLISIYTTKINYVKFHN